MSVSALMHWGLAQHIHPVSKIVFVALALHTKQWTVCLSVAALAKKTALDQRSIFRALAQLKKLEMIEACGKKGLLTIYSVDPCHHVRGTMTPCQGRGDTMSGVNGSLPSSSPPPKTSASTLPLFPNTPPLPPQGGNGQLLISKSKTRKPKESEPSDEFLDFWEEYPRKVAQKTAWKAWQKSNPPFSLVMESLANHRKSTQWRQGKEHIPYPATWINQERWDDEL